MTIPTIDLSAFHDLDTEQGRSRIEELRRACQSHGFFQLIGHDVPLELMDQVLEQSRCFFTLPLGVKESYDKNVGGFNRGYERLRAQNFEKKTEGDLKEGFYFGIDLPLDHPKVAAGKFNMGPNKYPQHVEDPANFRHVVDTYFHCMRTLAEKIVRLLCRTLGTDDKWVSEFAETPIAVLRMLHYPPQAPDASETERGIGAHTDFGAITILLQDAVGGLQVWDRASSKWADVVPTKGAFVVNLGNLMMRWTNDEYISNLHRVINKSGCERYSVPFFFSGNPDFLVECLPNYVNGKTSPKYPPVTVEEWICGRYADTYGSKETKAVGELSSEDAANASNDRK